MLNDNQKRSVRAIYHAIDDTLIDVLDLLDSTRYVSPLSQMTNDAKPEQFAFVADQAERIRSRIRDALATQNIPIAPPLRSTVWSARTEILMALVTLEELAPRRLQGYGNVSPPDAQTLNGIGDDLRELLHGIESFLARGSQPPLLPNQHDQAQMADLAGESALQVR